jgi:hypothetical protein
VPFTATQLHIKLLHSNSSSFCYFLLNLFDRNRNRTSMHQEWIDEE